MKRVVSIIITLILGMLILGGCAATPPTESDAQKVFSERFPSIKIISFTKTDGKLGTDGSTYKMYYSTVVEENGKTNYLVVGFIEFDKTEKGWKKSKLDWEGWKVLGKDGKPL